MVTPLSIASGCVQGRLGLLATCDNTSLLLLRGLCMYRLLCNLLITNRRGKAPAKLDSLIASLDAKYVKSTARKGKGKREPSVAPEEPSDEQFEAARYAEYIAWEFPSAQHDAV